MMTDPIADMLTRIRNANEIERPAVEMSATNLKVALANEDMFRRYGLDRPNFLANISMRVDSGNAGRPVIKLRSQNAVTEPFVSFTCATSGAAFVPLAGTADASYVAP